MTFTGKQLNELGCPPDIIKFFVNKEFKDEAEVTEAFNSFRKTPPKSDEQKEIERILRENPDCACFGDFPMPHAALADNVSDNPITGSRWAGKSRCRIGTDPKGRGKYNKMVKRRKKKGYR